MVGQVQEFNRVVDHCLDGMRCHGWTIKDCLKKYPTYQGELEPILLVAASIQAARKEIRPSKSFRQKGRARLIGWINDQQAARRRWYWFRHPAQVSARPLTTTLAILALVLLAPGGIAHADQAVPGEILYSADVAVEQTQIALATPTKALDLLLDFAGERIGEAEFLLRQDDALHASQALGRYDMLVLAVGEAVAKGEVESSAQMIALLEQTLSTHETQLNALLTSAPTPALSEIQRSIAVAQDQREILYQTRKGLHPLWPDDPFVDDLLDATPIPPEDSPQGSPLQDRDSRNPTLQRMEALRPHLEETPFLAGYLVQPPIVASFKSDH